MELKEQPLVPTLAHERGDVPHVPATKSDTSPFCQHALAVQATLFDARDYISGDIFKVVRCQNCHIAFTQPVPAPDAWAWYYPPAYYGTADAKRFPTPVEWLQHQLYAARIRRVEKLNGGRRGRVLDVGCGRGFLLEQFRQRGWEVLGTEADDKAAAHAQRVLQLPVKVGALEALDLPAASFDAIVLWHVLEHLADPTRTLVEVHRLLRPGGTLLVGVPNFGSWEARLCRDKWFHLDVPRHLAHFTPASLERALQQAGLRLNGRGLLAPEYDVFSFVQSLLNRVGLRHNYLYNLLRGQGAKVLGNSNGQFAQLIGTLLLGAPLTVISLPATLLAGLLRQGSAITAYARKS
jgi:SAM-dependent methyltransferase